MNIMNYIQVIDLSNQKNCSSVQWTVYDKPTAEVPWQNGHNVSVINHHSDASVYQDGLVSDSIRYAIENRLRRKGS